MVPSRFLPLLLLGITQFTAAITNDFVPLSCNSQLSTAPCVSWVTTFGTGSSFTGLVQIDCGTCVLMDHSGPSLSFLSGLDIIGKLVFPNTATYKLTIYATSITVQGELDLQSTLTPVTGTPNIHIIMMGQSDTQVFRPVGENAGACPTDDLFGNCRIGRKAITVAGGKVTCTSFYCFILELW
jgi:G8 domain